MTKSYSKPFVVIASGRGAGQCVRGPALVSKQGFGVRYDFDPERGIISNPEHDLFGHSLTGKIMFFTVPKGGVAASWALAGLARRGLAPLGIVFDRASPIFVQGAIFADLAIMDGLDTSAQRLIISGDDVELNPPAGTVRVFRS